MLRKTIVLLCGALAGCGNGVALPDEPDPLNNASFRAVFDAARELAPSDDMPVAGNAAYTGAVRLDLLDAQAAPLGAVTGQLSFTVDFDRSVAGSATVANAPVSGTLTGVTGETVDGTPLFWDGTLSMAAADEPSVAILATFTVADGMGGAITTRTGGLDAALAGNVTVTAGDESFDATATVDLMGSFVGPGGTGVWGTAVATLVPSGPGGALTGSGNFVAGQ